MSTILVDGDMQMTCGQHCAGKDWFKRGAVYVDRTIESRVEQDSPMSRLVAGGSAVLAGDSITNRYSTLSAAHDLAITGTTIINQAASSVSGSSRIQVGANVKIPTDTWDAREHDVAVYHTQYGSTFSVDAFQDLLSKFDPALFTGIDTPVQVASDGGYVAPAIIQAGGNVRLNASNDISNIVVDRTPTASRASIADTSVTPTALTTTVTLNSQLPPDLAQQQVNPTTLSGFSLPTGQNGLFRLSGQQGSNGEASDQLAPVGVLKTQVAAEPTMRIQTALVGSGRSSSLPNGLADVSSRGLTKDSGLASLPTSVGQGLPHRYLVETNPALTDLKQFLSSDYLLGNLNYNPDTSWKRLGDGLYEQRLIQQAIVQRTGQRFIAGLNSDEAQFKYLMDNALQSKQALGLSVGVSLTAEQVAALTHDIVWMEDQIVNGEHVLVPVLYLANANNRLAPNGALIQGSDVTLIAGNDLTNAGTLRATNSLTATANNDLVNSGLIQSGDRLSLTSTLGDISNRAGGIISGRDVSLTASRGDILNERTVTTHTASYAGQTLREDYADSAARIEASNNLSLTAGRDINNVGSVLSAGGNATLIAGRDVNLVSAQTQTGRSSGANFTTSTVTQLGSSLEAGRNASVSAGRDLAVVASAIQTGRNLSLTAGDNIILASAADESHSYSKSKKVTRQEDHVTQQATTVMAGGDFTAIAGKDLTLIASRVESQGEAYLYAGKDLNVLAAQDIDYSLYDMKKKGSFGAKKTKRDEVTDVRNIGSEIKAGGDITLQSEGNQTYQAAKLNSGKDLTLDSGGNITFEAVKDLHQESHEKSGSSAVWQSAKGKGSTDETLRQSELAAQGQLAIKAVQGLKIDVKEVNGQTVSQTIDAMVKADPNLAWIKQAEERGDVDLRQVKEIHDSFKYSSSGLSGPAALVIAIVVAYFTAGAASTLIGNMAGAAAGSGTSMAAAGTATASAVASGATAGSTVAAGWANVALAGVATSAASSAAVSAINNRGDLGAVLKEITSSSALKGYVSTALTAAFTAGVLDSAFGVTGDNINKVTKGFDLSKVSDLGKFGAYLGAQGAVQAVTQTAIQGGSLGDSLQNALTNQLQHLLQAASFNAVGDLAGGKLIEGIDWKEGGPEKTALHALAGGLLNQAMGGDFATGALAAGANEVLIERLSGFIKGNKGLELAVSQLIGIAVATATGGDVNKAAELTKNATAYNRQLHPQEEKWLRDNAKRFAKDQGISEQEAMERLSQQALKDVDYLWRSVLSDGNDNAAQAFLSNSGQSFTNDLGDKQALFTASGQQLFRPEMFADTANAQFYREFVQSGVSRSLSTGVLKELKDSGIAIKDGAADLGKLLVDQPTAVLAGIWNGIKGLPESAYDSFRESGKALGEGAAVAFNEDISSKLNAIYGLDVSTAQQTMLLVRTISAVAGAGTAGSAGNAGAKLTGKVAETVGKQLDEVLNSLAEKVLIRSGGALDSKGNPLLDMSSLTNDQKRIIGEVFGEATIAKIVPGGEKLARMQSAGSNGIDDLYKVSRSDVDYVMVEYKFVGNYKKGGSSSLGTSADGRQGSESWLLGSGRLEKAVDNRELAGDIADSVRAGRTESWVVSTYADGSTEIQVLDSFGKLKRVESSALLSRK